MKILVCDDHQLILEGIGSYLGKAFPSDEVHFASNKSELIHQLKSNTFDVLLQDIRVGKEDAREFMKEIRILQPELKIIIVSTLSDSATVKTLMNQGVDGYVIKIDGLDEIQQAIDTVLSGNSYLSAALKEQLVNSSLFESKGSDRIELTPREHDVLREILNEKSTRAIAETLFISEKTVENHRANLFIKFEVKNVTGLVKKAILMGYMD